MNDRFYFDLANEKKKHKQIDNLEQNVVLLKLLTLTLYRVTIQLVANLPLTSKQKFHTVSREAGICAHPNYYVEIINNTNKY